MKYAVLSMDVEDWYHLDYFDRKKCDLSVSMLDGIIHYRSLLKRHEIVSTFFVLGELAKAGIRRDLIGLKMGGSEIASHGWAHQRPLTMSQKEFSEDLKRSKGEIEDVIGERVEGYRAPCFNMDRLHLESVREAGYSYDSSRILCDDHPLYGNLDVEEFEQVTQDIFRLRDFFEFQVSTLSIFGREVPVSGGGYLRIFPWPFMKWLLRRFLKKHNFYVLYIHPFELSEISKPIIPANTHSLTRRRFLTGRQGVARKLDKLIRLLKEHGFTFTTFGALRKKLIINQVL